MSEGAEAVKSAELPADGFKAVMRPLADGDMHFLLNAWMQSYRTGFLPGRVPLPEFYRGQQNLIAELAMRRRVIVACDETAPDYIYGFACGTKLADGRALIDYVYVKKHYRNRGLARDLLGALGCTATSGAVVTHLTPGAWQICARMHWVYNPYYNCLGYSDV